MNKFATIHAACMRKAEQLCKRAADSTMPPNDPSNPRNWNSGYRKDLAKGFDQYYTGRVPAPKGALVRTKDSKILSPVARASYATYDKVPAHAQAVISSPFALGTVDHNEYKQLMNVFGQANFDSFSRAGKRPEYKSMPEWSRLCDMLRKVYPNESDSYIELIALPRVMFQANNNTTNKAKTVIG